MDTVYKPQWISGRYHKSGKNSKALLYNNLEGMSFLFENESADIINEIIKYDFNNPIPINELVEKSDNSFNKEDIVGFCEELIDVGILTMSVVNEIVVDRIREKIREKRRIESETKNEKTIQEKLPFYISSAENDYSAFIEKDKIPLSVMIELTYNCNEKCIHCYNPGASRNIEEKPNRNLFEELNYYDYERLLRELKDLGVAKISLTGGEPFVKKDIWKIIELIHQYGFSFEVFTNGILLNEDVDRLLQYFPHSVKISVYSANEEVHDSITQVKGSLKKSLTLAKKLQNKGVPIYFNCPIMKDNLSSYHTVYNLSKEYNAISQFDVNLIDSLDGDIAVSKHLQISNYELEILLRDPNIPLYVGKEAPGFGKKTLQKDEPFCGAGINLFNITPEGYVTPCNSFPASFGNLKSSSFKEIIFNGIKLEKWQSLKIDSYEECGKYEQCSFCNRCPGQSFIEHGTPLKKSTANHNLAFVRKNLADNLKNGYDPLNGLKPFEIFKKNTFRKKIISSEKNNDNNRNKTLKI